MRRMDHRGAYGFASAKTTFPYLRAAESRSKSYNTPVMTDASDTLRERTVVCLVAGRTALDGFSASLRYLQVGLADEFVDSIVVVPEHRRAALLTGGPGTVVTYAESAWGFGPWARRRVVAAVRAKIDALKHDGPVVVHALDTHALPIARELVGALTADFAMTVSSLHGIDSPLVTESLARAGAVITASDALARQIEGRTSAAAHRRTIGFGARIAESPAPARAAARSRALLYMGGLRSERAGEVLLRAAKRVSAHHANLLVFIVGKGPAEPHWRRVADSLDIRSGVIFTGNIDNWRTALDGADVYCVPTPAQEVREEPVQALADGLAVVAAQGSVYDCFRHEENVLMFPDGDEEALATAIRRVLEEPVLAARLGESGRAHARESHSIGYMVKAHVDLYDALTERKRTISMPGNR